MITNDSLQTEVIAKSKLLNINKLKAISFVETL